MYLPIVQTANENIISNSNNVSFSFEVRILERNEIKSILKVKIFRKKVCSMRNLNGRVAVLRLYQGENSCIFVEELKRRLEENKGLQKENLRLKNELDEAKSQLVVADLKIQNDIMIEKRKAQEEIASLQQVIHETVEESSCSRKQLVSEVSKLQISFDRKND